MGDLKSNDRDFVFQRIVIGLFIILSNEALNSGNAKEQWVRNVHTIIIVIKFINFADRAASLRGV